MLRLSEYKEILSILFKQQDYDGLNLIMEAESHDHDKMIKYFSLIDYNNWESILC